MFTNQSGTAMKNKPDKGLCLFYGGSFPEKNRSGYVLRFLEV